MAKISTCLAGMDACEGAAGPSVGTLCLKQCDQRIPDNPHHYMIHRQLEGKDRVLL